MATTPLIGQDELEALFSGLRPVVTVADEPGRIVFLNDLALAYYGDRVGEALIGMYLDDCHDPASQDKFKRHCARYRAGDLPPTRCHEEKGDGTAECIVIIPLILAGQFRGVAELVWTERPELVLEL